MKCPNCGEEIDDDKVAKALKDIAHNRDIGINNW